VLLLQLALLARDKHCPIQVLEFSAALRSRDREKLMAQLAKPSPDALRVVVASDVVARGIDVPDVTTVVSFDPPLFTAGYAHRSGRTARAFTSGISVTLCLAPEMAPFRNVLAPLGRTVKTASGSAAASVASRAASAPAMVDVPVLPAPEEGQLLAKFGPGGFRIAQAALGIAVEHERKSASKAAPAETMKHGDAFKFLSQARKQVAREGPLPAVRKQSAQTLGPSADASQLDAADPDAWDDSYASVGRGSFPVPGQYVEPPAPSADAEDPEACYGGAAEYAGDQGDGYHAHNHQSHSYDDGSYYRSGAESYHSHGVDRYADATHGYQDQRPRYGDRSTFRPYGGSRADDQQRFRAEHRSSTGGGRGGWNSRGAYGAGTKRGYTGGHDDQSGPKRRQWDS
jgi:superfamily II DNA/RNA helicase